MKRVLSLVGIISILLMSFSIEKRPDVKVSKNDSFTVELQYTAGTGYSWTWNQDTAHFDSVSVVYKRNDNLIGGVGTMVWTFKAKEKGDFFLSFDYKRPWENSSVEQKSFSVRVK